MLHEEQVAIQVVGEEEDGKEMVDVGLDELFRFRPLFVVLVCLLGNQPVLCGDGEVAHCEMEDLAEDVAGVQEGIVVLIVISLVLNWRHVDHLAY